MFNIFSENKITGKFSFYFIAVALILSAVIFLTLIDNTKSYSAKTSVILIPKSEKAAKDSEHIIENMRVLPKRLSFYNKLVRDNNIKDSFLGFSDEKREGLWNKKIKTERDGKSSILDISVSGNDSEDAKEKSEATVSTLFNVISFYYDIKNDVNLKMIQEPQIRTSAGNWFWLAILSLIIGTAISFAVNFVSSSISNLIFKKQERFEYEFEKSLFDFKKFEAKKLFKNIYNPVKTKGFVAPEIKKSEPKITASETATKKSFAPENLPTAPGNISFIDEDYFRNNIIKGAKSAPEIAAEPQKIAEAEAENQELASIHREPTPEELKRRLNQLLKGEL